MVIIKIVKIKKQNNTVMTFTMFYSNFAFQVLAFIIQKIDQSSFTIKHFLFHQKILHYLRSFEKNYSNLHKLKLILYVVYQLQWQFYRRHQANHLGEFFLNSYTNKKIYFINLYLHCLITGMC